MNDKDARGWLGKPVYRQGRGGVKTNAPQTDTRGSNVPFGFKPPTVMLPQKRRTRKDVP